MYIGPIFNHQRGRAEAAMSRVLALVPLSFTALALAGCRGQRVPPERNQAVRADSVPRETLDIYAHTRAGMLSPEASLAQALVYVPETLAGDVTVIDPKTYTVIGHFQTGNEPQHVVPGYDLKTLWATNDKGNTLTPIDPRTGAP